MMSAAKVGPNGAGKKTNSHGANSRSSTTRQQ
jgi:hypothetical protein